MDSIQQLLVLFESLDILYATIRRDPHTDVMTEEKPVPVYKLFGERDVWPAPEPFHHETISARSVLHDWEITPHSHADLLQVLLLRSGEAGMTLETERFELPTPAIVVVPPGCVHGFRFVPEVVGQVISIPRFLLDELEVLPPELRRELSAPCVCPLAPGGRDLALLAGYFERFAEEYAAQNPGRLGVLTSLLSLILAWLARSRYGTRQAARPLDRHRLRVDRFIQLVDAHFSEHRPIGFYADRLGVSSAQLNHTCRRETGKSAQQLVHERLHLEARRLLAYSALDVTAIAYALGFSDPAYFSRFFSRMDGIAPREFRRRHGQG